LLAKDEKQEKRNLLPPNITPDLTNGPIVRDKLLITGDDVLIEYVHRLMQAV
jgi:hypothetical protein